MDADGVSFGDFGESGASGGGYQGRRGSGGGAGGKPAVDQDLMDTWYPDCRECTCCKVRIMFPGIVDGDVGLECLSRCGGC